LKIKIRTKKREITEEKGGVQGYEWSKLNFVLLTLCCTFPSCQLYTYAIMIFYPHPIVYDQS